MQPEGIACLRKALLQSRPADARARGSTAIWRITFLPGRDEAARLTESIEAAGDELERGLTRAREYSTQVGTGFMRIEVHPGDLPVAFAGSRWVGVSVVGVNGLKKRSRHQVGRLLPTERSHEDCHSTRRTATTSRMQMHVGPPQQAPAKHDFDEWATLVD